MKLFNLLHKNCNLDDKEKRLCTDEPTVRKSAVRMTTNIHYKAKERKRRLYFY